MENFVALMIQQYIAKSAREMRSDESRSVALIVYLAFVDRTSWNSWNVRD